MTFGAPTQVTWPATCGAPGTWSPGWYGYAGKDTLLYTQENVDDWTDLTTIGWSVESDITSSQVDYRIFQSYSLW